MNFTPSTTYTFIYYRIIAIWILCEALLGSIIFTFNIPVSGLVIGSCSVVCISLIAWYAPEKGVILKATVLVAVFKMMLSPQAPPPAYIAVFFQGLMGEILFWNKKYFKLSCLLLAILALLESAFQRILVITILYGNDFWTALNSFLQKITGSNKMTDYSYFIIILYALIHLIAGIVVGIWAGFLPYRIQQLGSLQKKYVVETDNIPLNISSNPSIKNRRLILFIIWILLITLYAQSYFNIGNPWLPSQMALRILIRSFIIVLSWIFLINPLLKKLLHKWLEQKKRASAEQVQQVLNLLPSTQVLMNKSWKLASEKRGLNRLVLFSKIILINIFYPKEK